MTVSLRESKQKFLLLLMLYDQLCCMNRCGEEAPVCTRKGYCGYLTHFGILLVVFIIAAALRESVP
jgi:hypothetical protein